MRNQLIKGHWEMIWYDTNNYDFYAAGVQSRSQLLVDPVIGIRCVT